MVLWSPKKLCKPPASCNHSGLNKNYHNNNNKLVFQGCSECNREDSRSRYSTKYQRSTSGESNKYNKQNEQKKKYNPRLVILLQNFVWNVYMLVRSPPIKRKIYYTYMGSRLAQKLEINENHLECIVDLLEILKYTG